MSKFNSSFGIEKILSIISNEKINVHFIGVGGAGMSSLFCLTKYFGLDVSGSDIKEGEFLSSLKEHGADVFIGSRGTLPENTALCVYSLAIDESDSELLLCEKMGIPTVSRAEYMAALSSCYEKRIAVSGSHGKSTVTAMLSKIFSFDGREPTVISGASLGVGEGNFRLGALDTFIYEACEYKDSFLCFSPSVALFLNLELDHVDYFPSLDAIMHSFGRAMDSARCAIVNTDDERLKSLVRTCHTKIISVGSAGGEDYTYNIISSEPRMLRFTVSHNEWKEEFSLPMIGDFNISNAAMAVACAYESGVSGENIKEALSDFCTIARRLEIIGQYKGVPIYYDYAHHPTEIKASIKAVKREVRGAVAAVFCPHTYSRTKALFSDFKEALSLLDRVMVTGITGAREVDTGDVSFEKLAFESGGIPVYNRDDVVNNLDGSLSGIIIMGAGDADWVIRALLRSY